MAPPQTIAPDRWQAAKRIFRAGVDPDEEAWPGFSATSPPRSARRLAHAVGYRRGMERSASAVRAKNCLARARPYDYLTPQWVPMESLLTIDTDRWQAAKRIFRVGVDLKTKEWPGFLDRECGGDKPLRRLVERLLASDRRAADPEHEPLLSLFSVDRPTRPAPPAGAATQRHDDCEPSVGQIVSHYLILERLGAGGMGVVFRARDIHLERDVALKFLPPYLADNAIALRHLMVEAQAAAALDDPRICTIFEIGGIESGNLFIAETFWPGETLESRLSRGPLPTAEALRIAAEIARGLATAHAQGIVHRDIKPANILLTHDGQVKILDFGIAQTGDAANRPRSEATPGTRAYMSPEQIGGEEIDGRADLWSLGAVLYQMLVGKRPFTGRSQEDVTRAILDQDPEPLSAHLSGTSRRLEWLVGTALRKNPKARFPSANAFLEAVHRVRPEIAVSPDAAGPSRRTGSRPSHRPAAFAIGAIFLIACLLLLWTVTTVDRNAATLSRPRVHSIAVLPFISLSRNPDDEPFVDGMTEALINSLGHIQDLRVISRTSSMSYRGSELTLTEIAHELQVDAVIEGSIMAQKDRIRLVVRLVETDPERQIWMRDFDRSRHDLFSLQRELALAIAGEIHVALTPAEERHLRAIRRIDPQAQELFLKARHILRQGYSRARAIQAYEMFGEAMVMEPDFAEALAELASLYSLLAHFNVMAPEEAYPKSQTAALAALDQDPSLVAAHLALMRYHLTFDWDWSGAETAIRNGLEIRPGSGSLHRGYAWYLATVGQLEDALVEIETAAHLDPISEVIAVDRARMLFYGGRYPEAIARSLEILEIWPSSVGGYRFLGLARSRHGQIGPGLAALRRAVELSHSHALFVGELGYALAMSGATTEALETLRVLLEVEPAPSYSIAVLQAGLDDREASIAWLERAYEEHSILIPRLKVDPCLDSLREEPRFHALLSQVGLAGTPISATTPRAMLSGIPVPGPHGGRSGPQASPATSRQR